MKHFFLKSIGIFLLLFLFAGIFVFEPGILGAEYEDVPGGAYYTEAVTALVDGQYLDVTKTRFRPADSMTRCEFATLLANTLHFVEQTAPENYFSDVPDDHWAKNYVYAGVVRGYWSGYQDGSGRFGCNDPITRPQGAVILTKVLGLTVPADEKQSLRAFRDRSEIPSWARTSVAAVVKAGLFKGNAEGTFGTGKINRADSVVVTYAAMNMKAPEEDKPRPRRLKRGGEATPAHNSEPVNEPSPAPVPPPTATPATQPATARGPFQWTQFTASSDTRVIYVSSSIGSDRNDCLSEARPCKTIAAGYRLLRDGSPDWLLLKRGDVWQEQLLDTEEPKSGRSTTAPMLIASYGPSKERPQLRTGTKPAVNIAPFAGAVNHFAIVGLHFFGETNGHRIKDLNGNGEMDWDCLPAGASNCREDFHGATALTIHANAQNILIEDVKIEHYGKFGMVVMTLGDPPKKISDIRIRGNIIVDNYLEDDSDSSGLFLQGMDGLLFEGNVLDHNGWGGPGKGQAYLRSHNLYLSDVGGMDSAVGGTKNVVVRNNISARSNGFEVRSGGIVEDNLLYQENHSLKSGSMGYPRFQTQPAIRNNVIVEGTDNGGLDRRWGLILDNVGPDGIEVSGNILANGKVVSSPYNGESINITQECCPNSQFDEKQLGVLAMNFHDNIIYNWSGPAFLGANIPPPKGKVVFRNNIFQDTTKRARTGSPELIALVHMTIDPSLYVFEGNTYFSTEPVDEWFHVQGKTRSFTQWVKSAAETNARSTRVDFPEPTRSPASYHQTLGGAATADAFMAAVSGQSKGTGIGPGTDGKLTTLPPDPTAWRDTYTAKAVNAYIRAGFAR